MALPVLTVGDIVEATWYSYVVADQQAGLNVLGYRVTAMTGVGLNLLQLATVMFDDQAPTLADCLADDAEVQGIIASHITPGTGRVLRTALSTSPAVVGTQVQDLVPPQVTGLIRKRTDFAGRSEKGRAYIPFLPAGFITATGNLAAGGLAALNTLAALWGAPATFAVAGGDITLEPVILHRLPLPVTYTAITSMVASPRLATQRRRGDYGRPNPPFGG